MDDFSFTVLNVSDREKTVTLTCQTEMFRPNWTLQMSSEGILQTFSYIQGFKMTESGWLNVSDDLWIHRKSASLYPTATTINEKWLFIDVSCVYSLYLCKCLVAPKQQEYLTVR